LIYLPESWRNLPEEFWSWIVRLTGATPPRELIDREMSRINISHLLKEYPRPNQDLCYILYTADELERYGFDREKDDVLILDFPLSSVHFQIDGRRSGRQNSDPTRRRSEARGQLDPSFEPLLADVYLLPDGLAYVSSTYRWTSQYLNATPVATLERLYYNVLIPDGGGATVGDRLQIHVDKVMKLQVFSGSDIISTGPHVQLAGPNSDLVIRPGMTVAFQNTAAPPEIPRLAVLNGLITAFSESDTSATASATIRIVLGYRNLPESFMNWKHLGEAEVLQTKLVVQVRLEHIIAVHRIMPHALHQHAAGLCSSWRTPGSVDLVVVGDLGFEVEWSPSTDHSMVDASWEAQRTLLGMHGMSDGAPQRVKMHLARVSPFVEKNALEVISRNCKLYGTYGLGRDSWLRHIADALNGWALDKCKLVKDTTADNTLHLRIPGCVFATLLHDVLPWTKNGGRLGMAEAVTVCDGLLRVELPNFSSAATLLGRDTGLFDFNSYRNGYVELFPPIVCKWEMFDSGRDPVDSRSPDGFVAITFAYYERRNAHNDHVLHDTRSHKHSRGQLNRPPSGCPR
jgi:hypothetical protein